MHDVCVEGALPALGYSLTVNVCGFTIQKSRSKNDGLAREHSTQLAILLRNQLHPASLIVLSGWSFSRE